MTKQVSAEVLARAVKEHFERAYDEGIVTKGLHDESEQAMTPPPRDQQSELLPCPFCGNKPELAETHKNHWRVGCPKCGSYNNNSLGQSVAIQAWNTRALTAHDEAREHLGNLLAIIHGDGGHYQAEPGNEKATTDAIAKYYELRAKHDEALPGDWMPLRIEITPPAYTINTPTHSLDVNLEHRDAKEICAAHNSALRFLVDELRNIAEADTSKWDKECRSDADFKAWA